jgi:hypothetical protein
MSQTMMAVSSGFHWEGEAGVGAASAGAAISAVRSANTAERNGNTLDFMVCWKMERERKENQNRRQRKKFPERMEPARKNAVSAQLRRFRHSPTLPNHPSLNIHQPHEQ